MKGASRLSGAGDTDPLVLASIRQNEPENEEFVLYGDDKAIAGAGAGCGDITILPGLRPRPRPCRDPSQVGDMRPHSSSRPRLCSLHFWII